MTNKKVKQVIPFPVKWTQFPFISSQFIASFHIIVKNTVNWLTAVTLHKGVRCCHEDVAQVTSTHARRQHNWTYVNRLPLFLLTRILHVHQFYHSNHKVVGTRTSAFFITILNKVTTCWWHHLGSHVLYGCDTNKQKLRVRDVLSSWVDLAIKQFVNPPRARELHHMNPRQLV